MTQLPVMREHQSLGKSGRRNNGAKTAWHRLIAIGIDPELVIVVAFCAIGLLATVNVMLRIPDFGATIEQLEPFP